MNNKRFEIGASEQPLDIIMKRAVLRAFLSK